jgi:hypothetical protein
MRIFIVVFVVTLLALAALEYLWPSLQLGSRVPCQ